MDEQNNVAVVENKQQEAVQVQDKAPQNNPQVQFKETQPEEQAPKSSKDWDKFREARALDRKRAQEETEKATRASQEAAALKAALDAVLNKPQQQQRHQEEETEETDEQRIQKHVDAALAKREQQYNQERQRREQEEYPTRLVNTYSDFNQVCNTENLDYLEYHYPEVAAAFKHAPDGYDKWSNIYKAVKRFVPVPDSKKDQKKAMNNTQKPQSVSNPQMGFTGQQGNAVHLTEQKKAENYQRMMRIMNKLE